MSPMDDARESLAILLETERFLLEDIGGGGKLTLDNTPRWAEDLRRTRELIAAQKAYIAEIERGPGREGSDA